MFYVPAVFHLTSALRNTVRPLEFRKNREELGLRVRPRYPSQPALPVGRITLPVQVPCQRSASRSPVTNPRSHTPAGARGVTPFSNSCHEYTPFGPLRFSVRTACGGWQQAGSNTAGEARTQNGKRPVDGSADPVFGSAACRFGKRRKLSFRRTADLKNEVRATWLSLPSRLHGDRGVAQTPAALPGPVRDRSCVSVQCLTDGTAAGPWRSSSHKRSSLRDPTLPRVSAR